MSVDILYQAVPDDAAWWNRVLASDVSREHLVELPWVMQRHHAGRPPMTEHNTLEPLAMELIAAYPGIDGRNCHLERLWDTFEYLLSAQRREMVEEDEIDTSDPGLIAVYGERPVVWDGEEVYGHQGITLGRSTANTVARIADYLEALRDEDIQAVFDPDAMEAAEVSKSPSANEWDEIVDYFHRLQRFYREAASHGDGVLICRD